MLNLLYVVGAWLMREVVIKASVIAGLYWLMVYLMPLVWGYVVGFVGASSLTGLFNAVPDGVYWFLYALKFDVGIPLVISAYVSRFLIRRLPVVG
jgi:hypothetical protein